MVQSPRKIRHAATQTGPAWHARSDEIPAFFCRSEAPHLPLVRPWMDMETGDSFEHTERAAHPNAMENIQLKNALSDFMAAKGRNMSTREALATLEQHTRCPITRQGIKQPVRAPDNILYEAKSFVKSMHQWKPVSPLTREPFPPQLRLTVDKRMQQLSAACGTPISANRLALTHMQIETPRFAPSLEAMEEGRMDEPRNAPLAVLIRGSVCFAEGAVAAAVLRALGASEPLSFVGGVVFLVGATMLPASRP